MGYRRPAADGHTLLIDRTLVEAALPGYQVEGDLGKGGYGLVLAGQHRLIGRKVAIKILLDTSDDPELRARFLSEARVLAELDHPHVVRIHDYVEHEGTCLLVMELLSGGTLKQRMTAGKISAETTCAIGLAAAAALSTAHAQGVLHRDVKPDNMMFAGDGLLKVTDFGIAKIFDGAETTASAILGTPRYMAPEQIIGGRLFPATDLYALAGVLYEIFAERPLFGRPMAVQPLTHHHLTVMPEPLTTVPGPISAVIMRSLAKEPGARYPDAGEFALDLARSAARAFGANWLTRSEIKVRVDDEIREAALATSATPNPPPPLPSGGPPGMPRPGMPGMPPAGPPGYRPAMPPTGPQPPTGQPYPAGAPRPTGPYPPNRAYPGAQVPAAGRAGWSGPAGQQGHGGARPPATPPPAPLPPRAGFQPQPPTAAPGMGTPGQQYRNTQGWPAGGPSGPQYQQGRGPVAQRPADAQNWNGGARGAHREAQNRFSTRTLWIAGSLVFVLLVGLTVGIILATSGGGGGSGSGGRDRVDPNRLPRSGTAYAGPALTVAGLDPYNITIDASGSIYVADLSTDKVQKISPAGAVTDVAGTGTGGYSGDGGPATDAQIDGPGSVTIDSAGNIYIPDSKNQRIRKITPNGVINTIAGTGTAGFSGDGGPATAAALHSAEKLAIAPDGTIYIADYDNHRIRRISTSGVIDTVAGTGIAGYAGDGGPASAAKLDGPNDVALTDDGTMYIADLGSDTVRKITPQGVISTVAGSGQSGYSGDGGPATSAKLAVPSVTLGPDGTIYIADYGNDRVRKVAPNGTITTIAGTGVEGFSGDGGPATAAQMKEPSAVAVDATGALYIADDGNSRIRRIGPDGKITTIAQKK
jgi:serine/threonine protein kinase, bacterial